MVTQADMKKIAKLSGRTALTIAGTTVKTGADVTKGIMKFNDGMFGMAQDMANSFGGSPIKGTPIKDAAFTATNKGINLAEKQTLRAIKYMKDKVRA